MYWSVVIRFMWLPGQHNEWSRAAGRPSWQVRLSSVRPGCPSQRQHRIRVWRVLPTSWTGRFDVCQRNVESAGVADLSAETASAPLLSLPKRSVVCRTTSSRIGVSVFPSHRVDRRKHGNDFQLVSMCRKLTYLRNVVNCDGLDIGSKFHVER